MNESFARSLSQREIRSILPHADQMCLLDSVERWDERSISCLSVGHCSPQNPLRGAQGLSSANGIEYAAQAMALHAALVGGASLANGVPEFNKSGDAGSGTPPHGVLASVRAVQLNHPRLDVYAEPLIIRASLLSGDPKTAIYEFSVLSGVTVLLQGRASVLFDARVSAQPKA